MTDETIPATPDSNVNAVMREMAERSAKGLAKYGTTTERADLTATDWLQHAKEEMLDGAVYLHKAKAEIERLRDALKLSEAVATDADFAAQQASDENGRLVAEVERLRAEVERLTPKYPTLEERAKWKGTGMGGQFIPKRRDAAIGGGK